MNAPPDATETESELFAELAQLRRRLAQLEALEIEHEQAWEDQTKWIAMKGVFQ